MKKLMIVAAALAALAGTSVSRAEDAPRCGSREISQSRSGANGAAGVTPPWWVRL